MRLKHELKQIHEIAQHHAQLHVAFKQIANRVTPLLEDSSKHRWVRCPTCKEPDMYAELDGGDEGDPTGHGWIVTCTNLACPSNISDEAEENRNRDNPLVGVGQDIVRWWLREGHHKFIGAPEPLFRLRDTLAKAGKDISEEEETTLYRPKSSMPIAQVQGMVEIFRRRPDLLNQTDTAIRDEVERMGFKLSFGTLQLARQKYWERIDG